VSIARTTGRGPGVRRFWKILEAIAWVVALVFVTDAAWRYIGGVTGRRDALRKFAEEKERPAGSWPVGPVDQTLWSPARIVGFQSAMTLPTPTPLAVLRIPHIHLEVPVLEGTDDVTLDRGAGHIADTAMPGADGNAGIAGHRDGFFRGLKDISVGDMMELETRRGTETYRIEQTWIVTPEDVWVLDPTPTRALTLVTCYPFYFVGSAPQRFIVRAVPVEAATPRRSSERIDVPSVGGRRLAVVRSDGLLGSPLDR